jgi:hypothetical protein
MANALPAIRTRECHRVADRAGFKLRLKQYPAGIGIDRLEEPVERAVEDHIARGREHAAPPRKAFRNAPDFRSGRGIPGKDSRGFHPARRIVTLAPTKGVPWMKFAFSAS